MQTETRIARKSRKTASKGKAIALIFLFLLLLAFAGVGVFSYYILNIKTFYAGVTVDGIVLEGMTLEQAQRVVSDHNQPKLDRMKIILIHGEKKWEYDYNAIDAFVNVDEIVGQAYKVGREGSILDRLMDIYQAGREGRPFSTTLTYDISRMEKALAQIASEINEEPVDADVSFDPDSETMFTYSPHKVGKGMLVEETMAELRTRVENGDFSPYEILTQELHPKYTLEEVQTWTDKIVTFSTELSNNPDRTYNIKLSSQSYHGLRLDPGHVFSLNEATGPRDKAHGYRDAPVIVGGKKLEDAPGGGNCQTSSTLYGAVLRADLEIVERTPHSFPVSYIPTGQDATVNYPYADFKFRNNKDTPIFIRRYFSGNRLYVEIYGKAPTEFDKIDIETVILSRGETPAPTIVQDPNLYEGESVVEYASKPAIKAKTYRIYYKDGVEVKKVEEDVSVYPRIVGKTRVGTKKREGNTTYSLPVEPVGDGDVVSGEPQGTDSQES